MNEEASNGLIKPDLSAKGIWQPLPNESPDSYAMFLVYLELGFDATLAQVASKTARSYGAIRHLSSRHGWLERATAWRQHMAVGLLSALAAQNVQQQKLWSSRDQIRREQEWEQFQLISMVCNQALFKMLSDPEARIAPYELSPLLRLASQFAQKATADVQRVDEIPDPDNDPLTLQIRDELKKVCEEKRKRDAEQAAQSPPTPTSETPPAS